MNCQYKDLFGKVNEGFHSYKIFNIAIIDVLLTIIFAVIISHYSTIPLLNMMLILFVISMILHRLFCVRTTVDKIIFVQD